MIDSIIENYYKDNRDNLVKRIKGSCGGVENAEDIIQEAFCRALQYKNTFDVNRGCIASWMSKVISRCRKDFLKDLNNMGMVVEDVPEEVGEPQEDVYINKDLLKHLGKVIHKEGSEKSEVLRLHFLKLYKPREIAKILDLKVKNIRQIIWRFKIEYKKSTGNSI